MRAFDADISYPPETPTATNLIPWVGGRQCFERLRPSAWSGNEKVFQSIGCDNFACFSSKSPQIVRPYPATKPTHMSEMIALAENRLLRPGGLAASDLDRVFARLMSPAVDSADLYFEHSRSESWML